MEEKSLSIFEDAEIVKTLKQTVAQNLSNEEFVLFAQFCKSTKLNPFKKEIWAIKAGGRLQLMTGINGYLAIANAHPQYDGMEVDVEVNDKGRPIKATAKAYRKDRRFPSVGIALMSEFAKNTPMWSQMPSVMLTKVAKSIALREAFPQELNGLYTEEEMPREYSSQAIQEPAIEVKVEQVEHQKITRPCKYAIPDATENTKRFFEKRGGYFDEALNLWLAPAPLEREAPKLAQYRVLDNEIREEEAA